MTMVVTVLLLSSLVLTPAVTGDLTFAEIVVRVLTSQTKIVINSPDQAHR